MEIGGIDIILAVPADVPIVDMVLGRLMRLWPGAYFIDADETESHRIDEPWVRSRGGQCDEFLIYKDKAAVESWQQEGPTPGNTNTMLHFLLRADPEAGDEFKELTLVCDERTAEIDRL